MFRPEDGQPRRRKAVVPGPGGHRPQFPRSTIAPLLSQQQPNCAIQQNRRVQAWGPAAVVMVLQEWHPLEHPRRCLAASGPDSCMLCICI